LTENPSPSVEQVKEWMMGNLCRCTGYYKIIDSIMAAAQVEAR
jgi:aerobic-type carbon monoxide dehydrogenase small subunit (CoxS/CutS family)